jgi:FecR protein
MSRIRWGAVLAAVSSLGLLGAAVAQPAGTAQVILARAPAEVVPAGQAASRPLEKGARLSPGDRVQTGAGGAVELRLGDGSLVRLGELSDLEIDRLDVDAGGRPSTARFNLHGGQARAWVARQVVAKVATGTGRFAVETPTAVAAARQTDFAVVQASSQAPAAPPARPAGVGPPPGSGQARVYTFAGVVRTDGIGSPRFVECERNRFTQVEPQREPVPCRIIPLRERQDVLRELAFEAVHLDPGNPDLAALNALGTVLIGEKMAADWPFGGGTIFKPNPDPLSTQQGTANVTVNVQ